MFDATAFTSDFDIPFEALFVGRQEELNTLSHTILQRGKFVWIHGGAGTGKTALLRMFSRQFKDFFKSHRTEINYIHARKYSDIKEKVQEASQKPVYDNTLLIIDDCEQLSQTELEEIVILIKAHENIKLIISSRKDPDPAFKTDCYVIKLKSPKVFDVLRKRFELIADKDKRDKAKQLVNEYIHNAKNLGKSPREAITEVTKLLHEVPETEKFVSKDVISTAKDETGNIIEIKVDFIGILFSLILFLITQFSTNLSERNVVGRIDKIGHTIETVVSLYVAQTESQYYVNRPVNFRNKPNTKNSNILKVLQPNTIVILIRRDGRWMYVKHSDYVENKDSYGWVYEKYLSKVVK